MTEPKKLVNWYRVTVIGTAAIVALVALELIALIDYSNPESTAKAISAVIAVVGVIFTGTVSFIGIEVKRSLGEQRLNLDRETALRRSIEAETNQQLKAWEGAIKAVDLFKSASGAATASERAGALFALCRLREIDFALHLLESLWPEGKVQTPAAMWVLSEALNSHNKATVHNASNILMVNARSLPREGHLLLPMALNESSWPNHLDDDCTITLVRAISIAFLSHPPEWWKQYAFRQMIRVLITIVVARPDLESSTRHGVAVIAREVAEQLDDAERIDGIPEPMNVADAKSVLDARIAETPHLVMVDLLEDGLDLRRWQGRELPGEE